VTDTESQRLCLQYEPLSREYKHWCILEKTDMAMASRLSTAAEVPQLHRLVVRSRYNNAIIELQTGNSVRVITKGYQSLACLQTPHLTEGNNRFVKLDTVQHSICVTSIYRIYQHIHYFTSYICFQHNTLHK